MYTTVVPQFGIFLKWSRRMTCLVLSPKEKQTKDFWKNNAITSQRYYYHAVFISTVSSTCTVPTTNFTNQLDTPARPGQKNTSSLWEEGTINMILITWWFLLLLFDSILPYGTYQANSSFSTIEMKSKRTRPIQCNAIQSNQSQSNPIIILLSFLGCHCTCVLYSTILLYAMLYALSVFPLANNTTPDLTTVVRT